MIKVKDWLKVITLTQGIMEFQIWEKLCRVQSAVDPIYFDEKYLDRDVASVEFVCDCTDDYDMDPTVRIHLYPEVEK